MNKSVLTNVIALLLLASGYATTNQYLLYAGLFAFSGAITNWLAIHMLFEKVPGLYGSGVIPARFEEFKAAIKQLMMEQFFTESNIDRFLSSEMTGKSLNLEPVIKKIDFNPAFDSLVHVIENSQFGGMLAMVGGTEALQPMKAPFVEKMQESVIEISKSDSVKNAIKDELESPAMMDEIKENIEAIIDQRLNELTPKLVKEMVQTMIKKHLGWLVVWGGVFGGVIGLISAAITL
ncbi:MULTISPECIES: DUF445 family protein [Vibrio]|uniref:DUF445 family protein n=1 Tax=Vibrio cyclitrophicus ZF270 TaxID=1136176 RepID=A0AAN0LPS1_9VIBR|nr:MULTISPECIES: DUF445 family protein [Vibrio]KNH11459.1 hypothetical protein ACS79_17080 [Vibrio lentus]MBY7659390.1 DUF445 family protein [Vibrio atlanticus]ERM58375.1 hypothetical protein M565_ctg5P1346 [Vibrio cyclitrophicus FF75]KAA8602791.1 hypothetical protein F0Z19_0324 [Vibrio cyclitrophicus]MBE8558308.1 DUF445 family protein [Vibrio sp. OPT24]|tara:strand:- start:1417 stop:2121 length:705 start_codon:yes stop_codon:yes gene_type:complete